MKRDHPQKNTLLIIIFHGLWLFRGVSDSWVNSCPSRPSEKEATLTSLLKLDDSSIEDKWLCNYDLRMSWIECVLTLAVICHDNADMCLDHTTTWEDCARDLEADAHVFCVNDSDTRMSKHFKTHDSRDWHPLGHFSWSSLASNLLGCSCKIFTVRWLHLITVYWHAIRCCFFDRILHEYNTSFRVSLTCKVPWRSGCMWREQKHWPLKSSPSLRASMRSSCAMGQIGSCRRSRYSSPWGKRKFKVTWEIIWPDHYV